MRKRILPALLALTALVFASCDEHRDFPDTGMRIGDVLLSDGHTMTLEDYRSLGGEAVGVVYRINQPEDNSGMAFAVSLRDLPESSFTSELGSPLGTSTDITDFKGNENTYAMYTSEKSPVADSLFDLWRYGQSAYLPSVGQMTALASAKRAVNPVIEALGGDVLSDDPDESWYWTSTEVAGQSGHKAWLYSVASGAIQETPKDQPHKARPVITVYF